MKKLLVFTDLDGSLLDHDSYEWSKAIPAIELLKEKNYPVIFNSSKTASEIKNLKLDMENHHPYLSENGGAAGIPFDYFKSPTITVTTEYETYLFGKSYDEIIYFLTDMQKKYNFRGFYNMKSDEISEVTGLSGDEAVYAKQRQASEPIIWQDTSAAFNEFKKMLGTFGLTLTQGGRFIHIMSDVSKGKAVKWLTQKYRENEPEVEWITVGIGDSFNDIQMLEVVDYPVFISNAKTRIPDLTGIKNLKRPQLPGPSGWNQAVLGLLNKFHKEFE